MRSLLLGTAWVLLSFPLLFAMTQGAAVAAEPTWVLADENTGTRFYYDSSGITSPTKGVTRVSVRVVYTEEGKADALEVLEHAPAFEKLFESRYVYDIDCNKKKIHLLRVTHIDDDGKQIKSLNLSANTEWEDIPPGSRLDVVADETCPK
jgi:hypothetical protein